jgi:hypothetical protein
MGGEGSCSRGCDLVESPLASGKIVDESKGSPSENGLQTGESNCFLSREK